jgi:hypothetical protein
MNLVSVEPRSEDTGGWQQEEVMAKNMIWGPCLSLLRGTRAAVEKPGCVWYFKISIN